MDEESEAWNKAFNMACKHFPYTLVVVYNIVFYVGVPMWFPDVRLAAVNDR